MVVFTILLLTITSYVRAVVTDEAHKHFANDAWQRQQAAAKASWEDRTLPYIIAHRGASGMLPEHTAVAYNRAIEQGADFIECDVCLTKDLQPICRHEPQLQHSTDATAKFPDRTRTYFIDGKNVTGIFASDLTLAEVRTLRAVQPWPFRDQNFNGKFKIPTLQEYLRIALGASCTVGVYIETKHPTWHNSLPQVQAAHTSIEDIVLIELTRHGYSHAQDGALNTAAWQAQPVFLQSFEAGSLKYFATKTCIPLIQLLGGWPGFVAPDTGRTHEDMTSDAGLDDIATYAAGAGPWKNSLVAWTGAGYASSGLMERLHAHRLQVHPYTMRDEQHFVLDHLNGSTMKEYSLLFANISQGLLSGAFTDYTATMHQYLHTAHVQWNSTLTNMKRACMLY